jgi:PAS domain S-box-containing protein
LTGYIRTSPLQLPVFAREKVKPPYELRGFLEESVEKTASDHAYFLLWVVGLLLFASNFHPNSGLALRYMKFSLPVFVQPLLLDSLAEAVIFTDPAYLIRGWNPAAESVYGWKAEEVIGKRIDQVLPTEYVDSSREEVLEKFRKDHKWKGEVIQQTKQGIPLYIRSSVAEVKNEAGELIGLIAINQDATQEKAHAAEVEKYRRELEELVIERTQSLQDRIAEVEALNEQLTRLNQELEQFAFIASHDLQEPLITVRSFAHLLQRKYGIGSVVDEAAIRNLEFIQGGVEQMSQMVAGLMTFSRIGSNLSFIFLDLEVVVKGVLEELKDQIQESQAEIQIDDLPIVWGDQDGIHLLLKDLISNALKFHSPNRHPEIYVFAQEREQEWKIGVQDQGIGIEAIHLKKIFSLFFRVHNRRAFAGIGIGLARCKKVIGHHKGSIGVTSVPGRGSLFWFTLQKKK